MRQAARPRGGALHPRDRLVAFLMEGPSLQDDILPKNHVAEGFIPFGLRLIFIFFEILKQVIKQQYGLGLRLIG